MNAGAGLSAPVSEQKMRDTKVSKTARYSGIPKRHHNNTPMAPPSSPPRIGGSLERRKMFAEWQSRATLARLLRVVVALRQEVIFIAKLIFQL